MDLNEEWQCQSQQQLDKTSLLIIPESKRELVLLRRIQKLNRNQTESRAMSYSRIQCYQEGMVVQKSLLPKILSQRKIQECAFNRDQTLVFIKQNLNSFGVKQVFQELRYFSFPKEVQI